MLTLIRALVFQWVSLLVVAELTASWLATTPSFTTYPCSAREREGGEGARVTSCDVERSRWDDEIVLWVAVVMHLALHGRQLKSSAARRVCIPQVYIC